MKECNVKKNRNYCNCTYEPCARKGVCCECVSYHRGLNQLPACYFSESSEKSYDRSVENFIRQWSPSR